MSEINYNTFAQRLDYFKKNPSAFMEEMFGIKLSTWQKYIVDNMSKFDPVPRRQMRRWNNYIKLCFAYLKMEDDDHIVIASPKEWNKLSKVELLEYLENYWK